jgi:DNA-binding MarR family transcriptional regulator
MVKDILGDPDFKLWVILMQASDFFAKARAKEVNRYGVTYRQSGVLFLLTASNGKATMNELSRWLMREPHSILVIVNRMEKDGLITKEKGKDGKGRTKIVITKKGRQAYERCLKLDSIRDILSVLSKRERDQLFKSLKKIRVQASELLNETEQLSYP